MRKYLIYYEIQNAKKKPCQIEPSHEGYEWSFDAMSHSYT